MLLLKRGWLFLLFGAGQVGGSKRLQQWACHAQVMLRQGLSGRFRMSCWAGWGLVARAVGMCCATSSIVLPWPWQGTLGLHAAQHLHEAPHGGVEGSSNTTPMLPHMRSAQTAFVAFIVSTTFPRLPKDDLSYANLYLSVCFFSLMCM